MKLPTQPRHYDANTEQQRSGIIERELLRLQSALSQVSSSTTSPSSETVSARAEQTSQQQIYTSDTLTVNYGTEVRDDGGLYSTGTPTRMTAPSSGWYSVAAGVSLSAISNDGNAAMWIVKVAIADSSERIIAANSMRNPAGSLARLNATTTDYFSQGDYIYVRAVRTYGGDPVYITASPETFMSMHKV